MNLLSVIFRGLAVLGGIAAVVLYFMVTGQLAERQTALDTAETNLASAQSNLTQKTTEADELGADLRRVQGDLSRQRDSFSELQQQFYASNQEVSRLRAEVETAQSEVSSKEREVTRLQRELLAANEATQSSGTSDEEVQRFEQQIAQLRQQVQELRQESQQMAANRGANMNRGQLSTGDLKGTIAGVSAESGVIVLNIGSLQGLSPDVEYTLRRGGFTLAKVRAQEVARNHTIATILPGSGLPEALNLGDVVSILGGS